ncbi:MAG: DUF3445 domain-containing protein [Cereibacter sphaeroides]|uniref:DUF3445 domain-containing protein n=1 Tax=Cereibacter sphaeroides TaxID=1063 RepID=A0A2W5U8W6_CERSP|nr:MAG: DUF3445 domain-containing protein [Cereibacter sphaeroides]
MPAIQKTLPFAPWIDPRTARLPGVLPMEGDDWLRVDDAFAAQMALRDDLLLNTPEKVHALLPQGRAAAEELYAKILARLADQPGYGVGASEVRRPDGVVVPLDPTQPMLTLGRLVQEDLCLLEREGEEHVLTGAALCFPASWTLAQKIGRPLSAIHTPVPVYDERVGRSVQRMFDALRVEQPLWRANWLLYDDPTLHQPRLEGVARPKPVLLTYVRSERQSFVRLPETRAVVFAIHTYVVRLDDLAPEEAAALRAPPADP